MSRRFGLILSILPVMLFPQSSTPAPLETEIDAPERLQMLVREATCAEASPTMSAKLNGTSLSDVLSSNPGGRSIFYVSPDGNDSWSGLLPTADQQGGDGPFASIERALMLPVRKAAPTPSPWVRAITILLSRSSSTPAIPA